MNQPEWYRTALREIGTTEIKGEDHNPRIIEYAACTSLKATSDEVAWCSSFVNWCMKQVGIHGTNSAAARSWLDWGKVLDTPVEGCVVILRRGAPPSGHVCFYAGPDGDIAYFRALGGNQSDSVRCSRFPVADILGLRWPRDVA